MKTSATAIETHDGSEEGPGCTLRYVRRYVLKNMPRTPMSRWAAIGNAVHSTYEQMFKFGIFKDPKYLINLYSKNFEIEFSKSGTEKLLPKDRGMIFGYGRKILLLGYETLKLKKLLKAPLIAEEWFNIPLSEEDGVVEKGHSINGKIDAIFEVEDDLYIIDYKTGKQMPSETEVRRNMQLTTYTWVVKKLFNRDCKAGLLYPQHQTILLTQRKPRDFAKLSGLLNEMIELDKIKSDKDLPIFPTQKNCVFCELRLNNKCNGPEKAGLKFNDYK